MTEEAAWEIIGLIVGVVVLLVGAIYGLLLWEIRRVGRNLHSLRTEVTDLLLPVEKDVRELQRTQDKISAQMEEAKIWHEMVLALIREVLRR